MVKRDHPISGRAVATLSPHYFYLDWVGHVAVVLDICRSSHPGFLFFSASFTDSLYFIGLSIKQARLVANLQLTVIVVA